MNSSLSKRFFWLCFFGFTSVNPSITFTQETDSTKGELYPTVTDPAQNRLFWMSTGKTMPKGKFSISDFEVFLLQLGYAPTDNFHLNFSYLVPFINISSETYWSFGAKLQLFSPQGYFQGLSIGSDVGFFSKLFKINENNNTPHIVTLTTSVSAGNEDLKLHINAIQLFSKWDKSKQEIPTFLQLGSDLLVLKNSEGGAKIIVETFFTRSNKGIYLSTIVPGIRFFGKKSAGEFAWPISMNLFGHTKDRFIPWTTPYASISLFF